MTNQTSTAGNANAATKKGIKIATAIRSDICPAFSFRVPVGTNTPPDAVGGWGNADYRWQRRKRSIVPPARRMTVMHTTPGAL
jgi:hypothetical protein